MAPLDAAKVLYGILDRVKFFDEWIHAVLRLVELLARIRTRGASARGTTTTPS